MVTNTPRPPALTSADVIAYLKSHPDFLTKNPEALDLLVLPKQQSDRKIADFQTYMIERLKADKTEAIETAKEIVETARHNMNNQGRIHRSVLRLLESESFEEFIESITSDLTTFLNVDITSLVIESDGDKIPHVTLPGIRIVPAGTLDKWMNGKNILHQSDISGVETVYGAGAQLVRSQVLVRVDVSQKTPPAMLAFGSRDPQMFQAGQGTEQVSFLAGVVERCIRSWLHLSI
ncbi:MAG TPA: DUF484 domain-containing protein [Rhodospirillaceae bacterium]|nr:DUF484 domain-containing protein [Rhodospirillaceae bacterium]